MHKIHVSKSDIQDTPKCTIFRSIDVDGVKTDIVFGPKTKIAIKSHIDTMPTEGIDIEFDGFVPKDADLSRGPRLMVNNFTVIDPSIPRWTAWPDGKDIRHFTGGHVYVQHDCPTFDTKICRCDDVPVLPF